MEEKLDLLQNCLVYVIEEMYVICESVKLLLLSLIHVTQDSVHSS